MSSVTFNSTGTAGLQVVLPQVERLENMPVAVDHAELVEASE
jgi:hypothetical protein